MVLVVFFWVLRELQVMWVIDNKREGRRVFLRNLRMLVHMGSGSWKRMRVSLWWHRVRLFRT